MISREQKEEIIRLKEEGNSVKEIIKQIGVSSSTIYNVLNGNKTKADNLDFSKQNETIYRLRKEGYSFNEIGEELGLPYYTVYGRFRMIVEKRNEKVRDYKRKAKLSPRYERVYDLVRHSYTIKEIAKLENVSIQNINRIIKRICEIKGIKKIEPDILSEYEEKIYKLRQQGLSHEKIAEIVGSTHSIVKRILKKAYKIKDVEDPNKIKIKQMDEKIYRLRINGLTQPEIAKKLNISQSRVSQRLIAIMKEKGETDERKEKVVEFDKKVYELRKHYFEHEEIANLLNVPKTRIYQSLHRTYKRKEVKDPVVVKREEKIEKIYQLSNEGLKPIEIAEKLNLSKSYVYEMIRETHKKKGEEYPRIKARNERNELIYNLRSEGKTFKAIGEQVGIRPKSVSDNYSKIYKIKDEQLARMIVKLIETRNATIEQVIKIGEYYGVDVSRVLDNLETEERE